MLTAIHVVPTGVGAEIGGYAGDATPVTHLLASVVDRLIVNPNVLNAAVLFHKPPNATYVEGLALDGWLSGRWALSPRRAQRVGLVLDRAVEAMPEGTLNSILNAANAAKAVHGVDLVGYTLTNEPLGCRLEMSPSGLSTGTMERPAALLEAAERLVAAGATAIAVMADLGPSPPELEKAYEAGRGVDPVGGLEAIASHLVVDALGVPCAHAPLLPFDPTPPALVDPRSAAESLGHTYLPCVLLGLSGHPSLVEVQTPGAWLPDEVSAMIVPSGCVGGAGALAAHDRGIPLIVVQDNRTALTLSPADLGLKGIIEVRSYLEAAGVLACMRAGVDWRSCFRPLEPTFEIFTKF